jgi:UDP-N-acetylglucosamine:LPS N-acetylglucosamine transferase
MVTVMGSELRIALVASSGGHLSQLLKLSDAWQGRDVFYVVTTDVVKKKLGEDKRVYVAGECNREHPLRVVRSLWRCFEAIRRERPAVVLSTGAAIGCLCCFIGRLFGAKVVWVDSITNVEHMSLSGRMVRHIANLCIVQWPDLAQAYPGAEYMGNII